MSRFTERVIEKFNELDSRVRALERKADDDTTLADLRTSMEMLTDAVKNASKEQQKTHPSLHSQRCGKGGLVGRKSSGGIERGTTRGTERATERGAAKGTERGTPTADPNNDAAAVGSSDFSFRVL